MGWGIFEQRMCKLDLKRQFAALLPCSFPLSSVRSHAPRRIQPLLTQLSGAARLESKRLEAWSRSEPMLLALGCFSPHYMGLPVILPRDNRGLRGAARPGRPQWQSAANLPSKTNLFDTAVRDMDLKSCLEKKNAVSKKKKKNLAYS